MLIDRKHIPWALLTAGATALLCVAYMANYHPEKLPFAFPLPEIFGKIPPPHGTKGGTPMGIFLGVLAVLIFIFAMLLSPRKKKRLWPLGSVQGWLRAHIWLTILTIPLVLLHCGFEMGGPMTTTLMWVYGIVMVTGFYGIALQQFMPRIMKDRFPREVVFEQIPYLRRELLSKAEKLRFKMVANERSKLAVAGGKGAAVLDDDGSNKAVIHFLNRELIPYLRRRGRGRGPLSKTMSAENLFRLLKASVSESTLPLVDELESWCQMRIDMDSQARMQHWLHSWLFIHIPASVLLVLLTGWHIYVTLFLFA